MESKFKLFRFACVIGAIILLISGMSTVAYASENIESGTYSGSNVQNSMQVISEEAQLANVKALEYWIERRGTTITSGSTRTKVLKATASNLAVTVAALPQYEQLSFQYKNSDSYVDFRISYGNDKLELGNITFNINAIRNGSLVILSGKAKSFDMSSYSVDKKVEYVTTSNYSRVDLTEEEINTIYTSFLVSALSNINTLLNDNVRLRLPDIGFTSYCTKISNTEAFTSEQLYKGTATAVVDNQNNPKSAYSLVSSDSWDAQVKQIIIGTAANIIIDAENKFNTSAGQGKCWVLMEYYVKNKSAKDIYMDDVVDYKSYYNANGNSITVSDYSPTLTDHKSVGITKVMSGGSATGWAGVLLSESNKYPVVRCKVSNKYPYTYTYMNTNPDYVPGKDIPTPTPIPTSTPTYEPVVTPTIVPTKAPSVDPIVTPQGNTTISYNVGEPNDSKAQATRLELGKVYNQELGSYSKYSRDHATDVDYFVVNLEKGKEYRLTVNGFYKEFAKTTAIIEAYDSAGKWYYIGHDLKDTGFDYYDLVAMNSGDCYIKFYNYFDTSSKKEHYYTISINDKNNPAPTQESQVRDFVARLYTVALGRNYDSAGLNDWTDKLISGSQTGAEVAQGFIFSEEFKNRNLDDSTFVDTLYQTMFGREADSVGKATWMNALENGMSREFVYHGFAEGQEFKNLCDSYEIIQGSVQLTQNRDRNQLLTAFVARNYTKALGRSAEEAGINDWTGRILNGEATPADVTAGFIFSPEFTNKGLSNEDFLHVLYQTYFDREPDEGGYNTWLNELNNGTSREYVVNTGFSCSQEFKNLVASFGL